MPKAREEWVPRENYEMVVAKLDAAVSECNALKAENRELSKAVGGAVLREIHGKLARGGHASR